MEQRTCQTESAKAITDALQPRFGETLPVDENLAGLDALARIASRKVHRRYLDKPVDPALLRLLCACALSAPSKSDLQQADIVILDKPEQTIIADLIPDQPFIRTAPAFLVFLASGRRLPEICQDARQAVPERSSRPVLQRRGRRRHRAGDIPRRRRRGRARHLPDQRDPRSFAEGQRHAQAAAARDPGRRDVRRLAVGEGPHQPAARAFQHAAPGTIRRRQSRRAHRRLRQAPRRDPSLQAARSRALGRGARSTAGRRTRRGNTACRSAPDFGAFVRKKGFAD